MNKKFPILPLLASLRPGQWLKNALVFGAVMFNGKLFDRTLFIRSFWGFVVFSLISSSSYIVNDILDVRFDRLHPQKKLRPIASGALSANFALEVAILLALVGLISSLLLSQGIFVLALLFLILHLLYSSSLKKYAAVDILVIASSFIIRTLAGEVLTGYHLPVWLMLTVVFMALFIASGKRRSELVLEGSKTRPVLASYQRQLLDFYCSTFATASLLSYSLFAFFTEPPQFSAPLTNFLLLNFPKALGRKWLMVLTIPFVIYGIMRYAQLIYEQQAGEKPEKLLTSDISLSLAVIGWGLVMILVIYVV
jgi:4-hydroxybenzoate polyprenyltransferase